MFIRHWKLFTCLLVVFSICGLFCTIVPHDLHAQKGGTVDTPSANTPSQPATLAQAQTAYWDRLKKQLGDRVKVSDGDVECTRMMRAFADWGWHDRCIDQCDQIMQRWPDKRSDLLFATVMKAQALGKLKRSQEAYNLLDAFEQRYQSDSTLEPGRGPFNVDVRSNVLSTKKDLLYDEGKYRESADATKQMIDLLNNRENETAIKYSKVRTSFDLHYSWPAHIADCYGHLGDHAAAVDTYKSILAYLNAPPDPDKVMLNQLRIVKEYAAPIQYAQYLMQDHRYTDALKIYEDTARNLTNTDVLHATFQSVKLDMDAIRQGTSKGPRMEYDDVKATYFTKVELQIQLAECLVQLRDKTRALQAVKIVEETLNDQKFIADAVKANPPNQPLKDTISRRDVDANWIKELKTVTIPGLKEKISQLK